MSSSTNLSLMRRSPSVLNQVNLWSVLSRISGVAKYALWIILLLNWRSLPFMWHIRVFRPVFRIHFNNLLLELRNYGQSRAVKEEERMKALDAMSPIGANPFDAVVTYKSFTSIDDTDFNGHLSNSCYSKTLDAARFKAAVAWFPAFFRAGGWMALGATHYNFLREIPMLTKYEVRLSMAAWDNKWMFLVARYVSHTKHKPKPEPKSTTPTPPSGSASGMFHASLRMPSTAISGASTPFPSSSSIPPSSEAIKTLLSTTVTSSGGLEPDGATLHCISISELCFKHGRITVPPGIALAVNGFSRGPESIPELRFVPASPPAPEEQNGRAEERLAQSDWTEADLNSKMFQSTQPPPPPPRTYSSSPLPHAYSNSHPPPHWQHVRTLRYDKRSLATFLRGGWKDVVEGEEWWVDALGGEVEERRVRNLEAVKGVKDGMVGARGI